MPPCSCQGSKQDLLPARNCAGTGLNANGHCDTNVTSAGVPIGVCSSGTCGCATAPGPVLVFDLQRDKETCYSKCLTNNGGCDPLATCSHNPTTLAITCECPATHYGDGKQAGTGCTARNCKVNNGNCGTTILGNIFGGTPISTCSGPTRNATCSCLEGWVVAPGGQCVDRNECSADLVANFCAYDADCYNTNPYNPTPELSAGVGTPLTSPVTLDLYIPDGSYDCVCKPGFYGDGKVSGTGCTDFDECAAVDVISPPFGAQISYLWSTVFRHNCGANSQCGYDIPSGAANGTCVDACTEAASGSPGGGPNCQLDRSHCTHEFYPPGPILAIPSGGPLTCECNDAYWLDLTKFGSGPGLYADGQACTARACNKNNGFCGNATTEGTCAPGTSGNLKVCTCKPGYRLMPGGACEDINECLDPGLSIP
ncbi:hypothetical protein WJX72_010836 [[Myrmecia] bisecta]|uniref:EGF-like domain-containing protein n=1 Tax=[Myrmecia] bisecta TaxID=41462 RepID=A0AAW1QSR4_9CHLO